MAHTQTGQRMTESHRAAQVALSASLVERLRDLFVSIFRYDDIDGSSQKFVKQALPVVMAARDLSTEMATAYMDAFRRVEIRSLVDGAELTDDLADPYKVPLDVLEEMVDIDVLEGGALDDYLESVAAQLPSVDNLADSLYSSTAGVAKARVKAGDSPQQVVERTQSAVEAKGLRLVADGGRAPLVDEVSSGRHGAIGYARVVDPDPCPFCAMLASRGAVYRSDSFASSNALFTGDNQFKVHDGCGCTLEPIYGDRVKNLPPESNELARQWAEVAAGQPDPWAAWRRYRESGTLPGEERGNASRGVDGHSQASAPQYGREKARRSGKRKGRKQLDDMNRNQLEQTLKGMRVRRAGLERELADLENRGQSVLEPGPAQHIATQLERLERQLAHGKKLLAKLEAS